MAQNFETAVNVYENSLVLNRAMDLRVKGTKCTLIFSNFSCGYEEDVRDWNCLETCSRF